MKTSTSPPLPRYLSLQLAAEYCMVSKATIRGLISSGKVKVCRPTPRTVRIDREELDRVMRGEAAQ